MKKLFVVTLSAAIVAASFAPAVQAKSRKMKKAMAAPMMMAPMNPRVAPNGDFYATPVNAGDGMGMGMGMMMAPLGVPGAVVGGVAQPLVGGLDGLGSGLGNGLGGLIPPTP